MQDRRRRISKLLSFMTELAAVLEPAAVAELVVERARALLDADAAGLAVYDVANETVMWQYTSGELITYGAHDGQPEPRARLATSLLLHRRRPMVVADTADASAKGTGLTELLEDAGLRSCVAVPLQNTQRGQGTLIVGHRRAKAFDGDDAQLVSR